MTYCHLFFFFFSSRRRHTRFDCDWSSDVCSSDLACQACQARACTLHEAVRGQSGCRLLFQGASGRRIKQRQGGGCGNAQHGPSIRSEEHTSELQSQSNLVCRLLLEKKKNRKTYITSTA